MSSGLIETYPVAADRFDEMLAGEGKVRQHWKGFAERLESLPDSSLEQRASFVRDAIESDGVTYSVHADPKGTSRPWELDMLPLILDGNEWQSLATAVAQRARLFDAIMADLYGPQTLLLEGLVPPALVFGQQGYKWPCHGTRPPGGRFLHLYGVDIGRSPDGGWWVIGDHTQTPSGAGYMLQNRIIVSRAFPDAFRKLHVETLAAFFRSLQEGLARMAPSDGDTPLVVLLTAGPYSETYFEHAFLARYLGFPLVEGRDLTVRNDTVFLKTLRGLRRVHAILRRLEDDLCDPLELRSDSALGVPGLLGAVATGRVLIANALGSGVLESSALFGFLPAISQRLLGEPLAMPSVASWWCGEEQALEYVLGHLDELVIKPAFTSMHMESVFGHMVKGEERRRLIDSILAQPHAYVAQEWVKLSQAPVWTGGGSPRLTARSVGLRLIAAATPNGYVVMPGALARVASSSGVEVLTMERGGLSKDTWVRAGGPVQRSSLLKKRLGVIDLLYTGNDIPSRVGENLFWMGRHSERCESSSRILRAALSRASEGSDESGAELAGLLAAARRIGAIPDDDPVATPVSPTVQLSMEATLLAAVSDPRRPGSVAANLRALTHNANHVRERLSSDNWHVLNRLEQALHPPPITVDQALGALDHVMLSCISLAGFAMDDMTRDEGWRFLIFGRRIERLAGLAGLIAMVLKGEEDECEQMLDWLLETANSIVTYRARYRRTPELLPVIHLLVFDTSNPHSVCFQIHSLERYMHRSAQELGYPASPLVAATSERLRHFDLTLLEAERTDYGRAELVNLLSEAEDLAYTLSDDVHHRFFIHTAQAADTQQVAA